MAEVVDRALRDFVRYTGDGLPNEPVGHPAPIGDPASGIHNPRKKDMRDALNGAVDLAEVAAEALSDLAGYALRASEPPHADFKVQRDGLWYSPPPLIVVWLDQSNGLGNDAATSGVKTGISPGNVIAYNGTTLVQAALGALPFNTAPGLVNNSLFHACHKLAKERQRPVVGILHAVPGSGIGTWVPPTDAEPSLGANWIAANAKANAALAQIQAIWPEVTGADVVFMGQGANEYDLAPISTLSQVRYPQFIGAVRAAPWFKRGGQIIFCEDVTQADGGTAFRANAEKAKIVDSGLYPGVYLSTAAGLKLTGADVGQQVHFGGADLVERGYRGADMYLKASAGVTSAAVDVAADAIGALVWKGRLFGHVCDLTVDPSDTSAQPLTIGTTIAGVPVVFEVDGVRTEVVSAGGMAAVLNLSQATPANVRIFGPADHARDQGYLFSCNMGAGLGRIASLWINPLGGLSQVFLAGHEQLRHSVEPKSWPRPDPNNPVVANRGLKTFRINGSPLVKFDRFEAQDIPSTLTYMTFTGTTPVPQWVRDDIAAESARRVTPIATEYGGAVAGSRKYNHFATFANLTSAIANGYREANGQIISIGDAGAQTLYWLIADSAAAGVGGIAPAGWKVAKTAAASARAELVFNIANGWKQPNGYVINVAGLDYAFQSGATAIPDLLGMVPYGVPQWQHFGAAVDGATDDSNAADAWSVYCDALRVIFPQTIKSPVGRTRLTRPLKLICPASSGYRAVFDFSGTEFICDFDRSAYPAFIEIGDRANPAVYQAAFDLMGRILLRRGPNCTYAPVGVETWGMAQSSMNRIDTSSWNNSLLVCHGSQNVTFNDLICYSGGWSFGFKDPAGMQATWGAAGVLDIVPASTAVRFDSSWIGKTISIQTVTSAYSVQITAVNSATQAVTSKINPISGAPSYTAVRDIRTGCCAVTTTSGSTTITLDGDDVIDGRLIGLLVAIPRAGLGGKILIAHVTGFNTGARTLTLDRAASVSLNPVASPLTQTTEIATPTRAFLSDTDIGVYSNGQSQLRFYNSQSETFKGVADLFDDAEFVDYFGSKHHGVQTGYTWQTHAIGALWANRISGKFFGECDARYYGQYRFRAASNTQSFHISDLGGRLATYEKLLHVAPMLASYDSAVVSFGRVSFVGCLLGALFSDLVDDENTISSGFNPPAIFVKPDVNDVQHYCGPLHRFTKKDFSLADGLFSYIDATGVLQGPSVFRINGATATLQIRDSDTTGFTYINFENNGGSVRSQLRSKTADGIFDVLIVGVPILTVTAAGVTAAGTLRSIPTTLALLPSPVTAGAGAEAWINNASVTFTTANYHTIAASGGANLCRVYSDGTNWRIG